MRGRRYLTMLRDKRWRARTSSRRFLSRYRPRHDDDAFAQPHGLHTAVDAFADVYALAISWRAPRSAFEALKPRIPRCPVFRMPARSR